MLAFDTETDLIRPGCLTPELVCVSYARSGDAGVLKPREGIALVERALRNGETIVGHNVAYDFAVLANTKPELLDLIFQHYEHGLVHDTMIREALALIRNGSFRARKKGALSLAGLAQKYLHWELDKGDDGWRTRYIELKDKPLHLWPTRALAYAQKDAEATLGVFQSQEKSPDEALQCKAAWALHMLSVRGVVVDPSAVEKLKQELTSGLSGLKEELTAAGILREVGKKKPKLTKDTLFIRSLVEAELGDKTPRTSPSERHPKGQVKIDAKTIQKTKNKALHRLVEYSELEKLLSTYVPVLESGTEHAINARFNVLVETGRTSCSGPNLQNQPRKPGVRECFIPRPGFVYAACDYDAAELRALAQVTYSMFKRSAMRDAIIAGKDLHLELGAAILGITYEEAKERKDRDDEQVKEARQFAKIANFGFPGGLGAEAFVKYANGMGYDINATQAYELRNAWFQQWPEMKPYFDRAAAIADKFGSKRVIQMGSGRIRGGVTFTQAANSMFQGLVADGAKDALFQVVAECYTKKDSPLYGSFPVCFVHDEIILECPEGRAPDAAKRLSEVMNGGLQRWLPDVPVTSEAHLMSRWYKNAKPIYDEEGKLKVWSK